MAERKTEIPGVYKLGPGVLINKDKAALQAYKIKKRRERDIDTFKEEITDIKEEIGQIRTLLLELLKKP